MTIQQFIEKALEGGYEPAKIKLPPGYKWTAEMVFQNYYGQPTFLLDPEAWKAVGSTINGCWACKGKKFFTKFGSKELDLESSCGNCGGTGSRVNEVERMMVGMIRALCDGKTVEEYLETL